MALFFDQEWFDRKLADKGQTRDHVAAALRISRGEVDEVFKDQREISTNEVTMLARLMGEPLTEVVSRAGIATPMPKTVKERGGDHGGDAAMLAKLAEMDQRLVRIERAVADLQSLIIATRTGG